MLEKCRQHMSSNGRAILHLFSGPNAHSKNPLKLFWRIKPFASVAQSMRWQVVVKSVCATSTMCKDVICRKLLLNKTTAKMATARCLVFNGSRRLARGSFLRCS
jgi:hypothetical protein